MPHIPESQRLKTCLEAGDVLALFPLLKTWSREELKALIEDADKYFKQRQKELIDGYEELAQNPAVAASEWAMKAIARARDKKIMDAFGFTTEVCSAAYFYLQAEKPIGPYAPDSDEGPD